MLRSEIVELLRCPLGKAPLKQEGNYLVCTLCEVKFPVRDEIPILMIDEAVMPDGIKDLSDLKCSKKM
jgi:uncharacterized protein YbaR (Trm112 family)